MGCIRATPRFSLGSKGGWPHIRPNLLRTRLRFQRLVKLWRQLQRPAMGFWHDRQPGGFRESLGQLPWGQSISVRTPLQVAHAFAILLGAEPACDGTDS